VLRSRFIDSRRRRRHAAEPAPLPGIGRWWAWSLETTSLSLSTFNDSRRWAHCTASVALPRTEPRRSAARLPRHRRRSSDVRRQRMARFYQGTDHQRINTMNVIDRDRARRLGCCSPDLPTFDELCDAADDELFGKAVRLSNHVPHALLPPYPNASQRYNLRHRAVRAPIQLPEHTIQLSHSTFLTHMLYKNTH